MPAVRISDAERKNRVVKSLMGKAMGLRNTDMKGLATILRMSPKTAYDRYKNPSLFRLCELQLLAKVAEATPEEVQEILI